MKPKAPNGRGSGIAPDNRFDRHSVEDFDDGWYFDPEEEPAKRTKVIEVFPKSIVNAVPSEDIHLDWSTNPYQGCEHGCSYCYARPTHEYWGYNAGIDFESVIMAKPKAPELLRQHFDKKSWKGEGIMFSGNTDCYQPIERKMEITRQMLEVCLEYRNPVGIITKNALILRDLDILGEMGSMSLASVAISITTMDDQLRRVMEPRTSTISQRFKACEQMAKSGLPVHVMMGPVIPGLNDHELMGIAKKAAEHGATSFGYISVRLNDTVQPVFIDWLDNLHPARKEKVLHHIKDMRGGQLEARGKGRMKGSGAFAQNLQQQSDLAKRMFFPQQKEARKLRTDLFHRPIRGQARLWD